MDKRLQALTLLLSAQEVEILRTAEVLSNQERAVFVMIGRGLTTKVIAYELALSVKTVETHILRIRRKLARNDEGIAMADLAFLARIWVRAHEGSEE
jgi:DNA-binding NarL/FixJ family response regulator